MSRDLSEIDTLLDVAFGSLVRMLDSCGFPWCLLSLVNKEARLRQGASLVNTVSGPCLISHTLFSEFQKKSFAHIFHSTLEIQRHLPHLHRVV